MIDLYPYVQYRCVVGSRAYGLDTDASDTDVRGFYLPPASIHWSLTKLPEQLENEERQECFWEFEKFLNLCLASNPNALECLNTPLVQFASPMALELLELRSSFLSKLAYERYMGYADAQFRRLAATQGTEKGVNWKHAMHMIRLLIAGETLLQDGRVLVDVSAYRDRLLAVKRGELAWPQVEEWKRELSAGLEAAFLATSLPDEPDRARVNEFLVHARRSMLDV